MATPAFAGDPWVPVGASLNNVSTNQGTDVAMTVNAGTPYVAFVEAGNVFMKHWTGAAWVQDGAGRLNATAGATGEIDIANDGTNEYVAWVETVGGFTNLFVKKWNGAAWAAMGGSLNINAAQNADMPSIEYFNAQPQVAWNETTATNSDVYMKKWTGAAWAAVGAAIEPTPANWTERPAITGDATNTYVMVSQWNGANYDLFARRWTGAAWATVGAGRINVNLTTNVWGVSATMQGANLVTSWQEEAPGPWCGCQIYVKQWNGAAWSQLGVLANEGQNGWIDTDIAAGVAGPWVAYSQSTNGPLTVAVANWTGTLWKHDGGVANTTYLGTSAPSIGVVTGSPWLGFGESNAAGNKQISVSQWLPTYTMVGNVSNLVTSPGSNRVDFAWTNPPDANYNGVDIYRSAVAGQKGVLLATVAPPTAIWSDATITNGTTYFYSFVTHNTLGDRRETTYETADSEISPVRYGGGVAADSSKMYVFGGTGLASGVLQKDVWSYDPATTIATKKTATLSAPRYREQVVWVGGAVNRFIIMGGDVAGTSQTIIQRYDPVGDTMATAAVALPAAREEGAAVYAPNTGRVYYLGGLNGAVENKQIYWYDPAADTRGTLALTMPQNMWRYEGAYWPADGCIYTFGGASGGLSSAIIMKFCPAANAGLGTVVNLPQTLPTASNEISVAATASGMELIGGATAGYSQTVNEFNPSEKDVTQHAMVLPRSEVLHVAAIGDSVYGAESYQESTKVLQVNIGGESQVKPSNPPNTPVNTAPLNNATVVTTTPTLTTNAFTDPDAGDVQSATQWQLRTNAGSYAAPLFDSGVDFVNFTSVVSPVLADGLYCWHARKRDNNRVWSLYSAEFCFTVDTAPNNPYAAANLAQKLADGVTLIASGAWTTDGIGTNVVLKFDMEDSDPGQTLTPWVEVRPNATPFSLACSTVSAGVDFSGVGVLANVADTPVTGTVNVTGLTSGTQYHWRACVKDNTARIGAYTNMGASPDFGVVNDALPTVTLQTPANGSTWADTTPNLVAQFNDANGGDTGTIDFEVCTANPTPAQTCAAAGGTLSASGSSVGGVVISANGTWTSTVLANASYFWRARARDQWNLAGPWIAGWTLTIGAPALSLTVDSAALALPTMSPGSDTTGTTVATITTSNATGYTLTATDVSDTAGPVCSVGGCTGLNIPDWTGTDAAPTTWTVGTTGAGGYFGLTVLGVTGGTSVKLPKWGTGTLATDFVLNKYAGMRTTTTTVHARNTFYAPADTVTIAYRTIASGTTIAGVYNEVITYTALANP